MEKKDCEIVKDMIPIYADNSCSESSKEMIEEHLRQCPECSRLYSQMISPITVPDESETDALRDIQPMKKLKNNLHRQIINCVLITIVIVSLVMGLGVNRGFQIIKPKYKKLAKEICSYTQSFLGKGQIVEYLSSLDPETMYEHDCNELDWIAELYSEKDFPHTIDLNGAKFAVTDNYYISAISASKPSTKAALDYQNGDIHGFLQNEWDSPDSLILPQSIYETIEDKRPDITISFSYGGQTYYFNNRYSSSDINENREIQIQSNLMARMKVADGHYTLSILQQAVQSASIVPLEIYEQYCNECVNNLAIVRNIEQKYIDLGFEKYKDIYKDRLTQFFKQYFAEHGTPVKCSVDTIWYVSGSNIYHCYIKLDFEDASNLNLNFEMNDSGTYYIYNVFESKLKTN